MPSKYQPLVDYLAAQPEAAVTLPLPAIEQVIGARLPREAWVTRRWWVAPRSSVVRAVQSAGWAVEAVNWDHGCVRFVRQSGG